MQAHGSIGPYGGDPEFLAGSPSSLVRARVAPPPPGARRHPARMQHPMAGRACRRLLPTAT